ncbi:hypothetical protein ACAH01_10100 [Halomicrobium sp. HM KBTZ05]|uniref:DUF7266 family protein n=1 Tax=Halomicrobium sp. HM KBTZ05 TaxID=3242663 RepID=UPI003557079E
MNDRAVSSTFSYVLSLAIATMLVTGLLVASGSFVEDRQRQVVRSELQVIGQQVSADIARADRLVRASDDPADATVRIEQQFPARITGTTYRLELVATPSPTIRLRSSSPEVRVTVGVQNRTALSNSSADGGTVVVGYDGNALGVRND